MEPKDYIVARIEGEYAILRNVENGGEVFIAMALLPAETELGSRLHFENFSYELIE